MTSSCNRQQETFQFISTKEFRFPSASAIEFYGDRLYVFGDDAPYLLILSSNYDVADSVFFWRKTEGRIPKEQKHDIESAMIRIEDQQPVIYGIGSMSTDKRRGVLGYQLNGRSFNPVSFLDVQNVFKDIPAVNIEGSCMVDSTTVFANRANLSSPANHLILFNKNAQPVVRPINLPRGKIVAGVSGLYYLEEKDLLLFTASEEASASTTADGAIGESYFGWIKNFRTKIKAKEFVPDGYIKLNEIDGVFTKQKVESVCVEKADGATVLLHLAADNDDGTSRFFKLEMKLH